MTVADEYRGIIDSLHTALQALDTAQYRYDSSEVWTRDYRILPEQRSHVHLAAGVILGEIISWRNDTLTQAAAITFACRFSGSPDSSVQAKLQTAQRAVMTMLTTWTYGDARALPIATFIEPLTPGLEWLEVSCTFQLSLNRSR